MNKIHHLLKLRRLREGGWLWMEAEDDVHTALPLRRGRPSGSLQPEEEPLPPLLDGD